MNAHLPSPGENRQGSRHPEFGLSERLRIDGTLYTFDNYLDVWTDGLGHELTGWTILQGMSTTLRVEVVR